MRCRNLLVLPTVFALLVGLTAVVAEAQLPRPEDSRNYVRSSPPAATPALTDKAAIGPNLFLIPFPPLDPLVNWREQWICESGGPAEVQGFRVQCFGATFLDSHIADCCIDGDHWQLKSKAWDVSPNTAVTTSPGPTNVWGVPGRTYNYGGTPWVPGLLDTYHECTYLHGTNLFLAASYISFSSDGVCTVTPDLARNRIDRTP